MLGNPVLYIPHCHISVKGLFDWFCVLFFLLPFEEFKVICFLESSSTQSVHFGFLVLGSSVVAAVDGNSLPFSNLPTLLLVPSCVYIYRIKQVTLLHFTQWGRKIIISPS